jgi:hypothetical protein
MTLFVAIKLAGFGLAEIMSPEPLVARFRVGVSNHELTYKAKA